MDILLAVATATISFAWYRYCHRAHAATMQREYYSAGQRNVSAIITDARVN